MWTADSIFSLKNHLQSRRISSYSRTGGNDDFIRIDAHERKNIAVMEGAGVIRHIWITLSSEDAMIRRNAVLRMYWDGEQEPSVESPLGDFFGQGWGEEYSLNTPLLAAAPAAGKSLVCYIPMPYGNGARVEIENQSDLPITNFYYYIDYEVHPSIGPEAGRFHAWWNRKLTCSHPEEGETEWGILAPQGNNPTDEFNYCFADIQGNGHFLGLHYFIDNPGPIWYGEGDDMWRIDGEPWPGSLHGTGTEDFFNSAWCPNEIFQHSFFGYAKVPHSLGWMGRTHCYRYFLADPVYFSSSLHASIESGHDNNLTLDLSSVAYWYQCEPHKVFPALPPRDQRQNMPRIGVADVHAWRHEFRKANGFARDLWGNEWRGK